MSYINIIAVFTTDLPRIAKKYKLPKSFALSIKILNCLTTTLFETFLKHKTKAIKRYNLGFE